MEDTEGEKTTESPPNDSNVDTDQTHEENENNTQEKTETQPSDSTADVDTQNETKDETTEKLESSNETKPTADEPAPVVADDNNHNIASPGTENKPETPAGDVNNSTSEILIDADSSVLAGANENVEEQDIVVEVEKELFDWIIRSSAAQLKKHELFFEEDEQDLLSEDHKNVISEFFLNDSREVLLFAYKKKQHSTHQSISQDKKPASSSGMQLSSPLKTVNPDGFAFPTYNDDKEEIHLGFGISKEIINCSAVVFFLKELGAEITAKNVEKTVFVEIFSVENFLSDFLTSIQDNFSGKLLHNNAWPETLNREFSASLNKFLASLTETSFRLKGKTVLFLPLETISDVQEARKQKDLVQRLEATLIHWTSQIKEIVFGKESLETNGDNARLITDIDFWQSRTNDLENIRKQIQQPKVKQIIEVLSNSSYLPAFEKLSEVIQKGFEEAKFNYNQLKALKDPSNKLDSLSVKDLPTLYVEILEVIRKIWFSGCYNTKERLTSLLKKVSNQIIQKCCSVIPLNEIFNSSTSPESSKAIEILDCCSLTCEKWKEICKEKCGDLQYAKGSVFAEVNAFVQRCKSLLEVCQAQIQFGVKGIDSDKTGDGGLPNFGGTKGNEIRNSLLRIKTKFQMLVDELAQTEDILNVRKTFFQDNFSNYKKGVKRLEKEMISIMKSAFKYSSTFLNKIELLETFYSLSKGEGIYRTTNLMTNELLKEIHKDFDETADYFKLNKNNPPIHPSHPNSIGKALWCQNLIERMKRVMDLLSICSFLPKSDDIDALQKKFDDVSKSITNEIVNTHVKWKSTIPDENLQDKLKKPILKMSDNGFLQENFDVTVLRLFEEIRFWSNLPYDIPIAAMDFSTQSDKFRLAREKVNSIVREYNSIIRNITPEEYKLFSSYIKDLTKKIEPGFNTKGTKKTIDWTQDSIDYFIADSLKKCLEVQEILRSFKENVIIVYNYCKEIEQMDYLFSDLRNTYSIDEFEKKALEHFKIAEQKLKEKTDAIIKHMMDVFKFFVKAEESIENEWKSFYKNNIQKKILDSLTSSLVNSLQKLKDAIYLKQSEENVEDAGKPLFSVDVVFSNNDKELILQPSLNDLKSRLNGICLKMVKIINVVPMLENVLEFEMTKIRNNGNDAPLPQTGDDKPKETKDKEASKVPEEKEKDKEGKDKDNAAKGAQKFGHYKLDFDKLLYPMIQSIEKGLNIDVSEELSKKKEEDYVSNFSHDKKVYYKRFIAQLSDKKPSKLFESWESVFATIKNYDMKINGIESTVQKNCLELDFGQFKRILLKYYRDLDKYLLDQLRDSVKENLLYCINFVHEQRKSLSVEPKDVYELERKLEDCENMSNNEWPNWIEKFRLIIDQCQLLTTKGIPTMEIELLFDAQNAIYKKFLENFKEAKVVLKTDEKLKKEKAIITFENRASLEKTFQKLKEKFEEIVEKANTQNKSDKQQFFNKVKADIDLFSKTSQQLKKELNSETNLVRYQADIDKAIEMIRGYKKKLNTKLAEENELSAYAKILKIKMVQTKDLKEISKELDLLSEIWEKRKDWQQLYDVWSKTEFKNLNVEVMEEEIRKMNASLNEVNQKVREWDIWIEFKQEVKLLLNKFIPVLQDLKQPTLTELHWQELSLRIIKQKFDHNDPTFNLEVIRQFGFENYSEEISTLAKNSKEEAKINNSIKNIIENWRNIEFRLEKFKEKYFVIMETEDIFSTLENDTIILSTLKISKFASPFLVDINEWEENLSVINEVVEILIRAQTQWKYLLNIFEVEDIQRQLPNETTQFNVVNINWLELMTEVNRLKNVNKSMKIRDIRSRLLDMQYKLEKCQKQLDNYLMVKRQEFPRFYFLSDDDLLEILGNSRDPNTVQKHLKNCFEGIYRLIIKKDPKQNFFIATAMEGKDGEQVSFNYPVSLDGNVEHWLGKVEDGMRASVKKILIKSCEELNKQTKREFWIKKYQGQLLITAAQLFWTAKVEECFQKSKKMTLKHLKKKWNEYIETYTRIIVGESVNPIPKSNDDQNDDDNDDNGKTLNKRDGGDGKDLKKEDLEGNGSNTSYLDRTNASMGAQSSVLTSLERKKLIDLVTIEVHARDVIDKLYKNEVSTKDDFTWMRQLRFYTKPENEGHEAQQNSAVIDYDYEYVGNSGRLVITPLTERCYMTLTNAIELRRGGNPKGPAGTGKTETVKDLAKNLGKATIVFNCSEGLDYRSLGRMFAGLVQSGAWSCFDEFNRIELDVLSVVATQISDILSAISAKRTSVIFESQEIRLNPSCGIFVTMNPGYAGRSELPDNLKALLRPISMMKPDSSLICQISLFAQGFSKTEVLSRKITTLFALMEQQLSKQIHYDFGLRSITSVLSTAGKMRRERKETAEKRGERFDDDEEKLLLEGLRIINEPRLVAEDKPLFEALISDLFPSINAAEKKPEKSEIVEKAIISTLKTESLTKGSNFPYVYHDYIAKKAMQLYDTKNTRHGVMLVGKTGSGKTAAWRTLERALTNIQKSNKNNSANPVYGVVQTAVINPKAIAIDELYGNYTKTRDWKDGIFSRTLKEFCADPRKDLKWILFDGPVDTIWVESMNSLLDDNKVLTLVSSERIQLVPQVSLLFEVEDLTMASPATVSRCGMVFFDDKFLGWRPLADYWLNVKRMAYEEEIGSNVARVKETLSNLINISVEKALALAKETREIVPTTKVNLVKSLFTLFDSLATVENGLNPKEEEEYNELIQKLFIFALIWSVGGSVCSDGRRKMDMFFRECDPQFPSEDTVYEYFVDIKSKMWTHWSSKLPSAWRPPNDVPVHKVIVPTVDTYRYQFLINTLVQSGNNVLIVGDVGIGKTCVIHEYLSKIDEKFDKHTINFSAHTSSNNLQDSIETKIEKKTLNIYAPFVGKRLVVFIDDFNMPMKEKYGAQPPLELLRQFMEHGFWYNREKITTLKIEKVNIVGAMAPPAGGRNEISQRLQSKFNLINFAFQNDQQIYKIFGTVFKSRIHKSEELMEIAEKLTVTTVAIFKNVCTTFLPIPSKSHCVFNLKDLGRVFQGMMQADLEGIDGTTCLKLWVHECFRVFYDRLNDENDRNSFRKLMEDKLGDDLDTKWLNLFGNTDHLPSIFGHNLQTGKYTEMDNFSELKKIYQSNLDRYNETPGNRKMDLVLFINAIHHLTRISRVLKQPNGHVLLVGIGGSGRRSLTRLAAHTIGYQLINFEASNKSSGYEQFRAELKKIYLVAGNKKNINQHFVFLISDSQINDESILEDLNTTMSTGHVANLFKTNDEELVPILDAYKDDNSMANEVMGMFLESAKEKIHLVLCMSPVGSKFRERIRMFPALTSCMTIDWFSEWPASALKEVAINCLNNTGAESHSVSSSNLNRSLAYSENQENETEAGEISETNQKADNAQERSGASEKQSMLRSIIRNDFIDPVSDSFCAIHQSVIEKSEQMFEEQRRRNYVTPTNYISLVECYKNILIEKRKEIQLRTDRLSNGLTTLENAKEQVGKMSLILTKQQEETDKAKKQADVLMRQLVKDKTTVSEQQQIASEAKEKLKKESEQKQNEKEEALAELNDAKPDLQQAEEQIGGINPSDLAEIANYKQIAKELQNVLAAVIMLTEKKTAKPTADEIKKALQKSQKLIAAMKNFGENMKKLPDAVLSEVKKNYMKKDFTPDIVGKTSAAGKGLCAWVIAIVKFAELYKKVQPKFKNVEKAEAELAKQIELLEEKEKEVKELEKQVAVLNKQYETKIEEIQMLTKQQEETEAKLRRASQLVDGLEEEGKRWSVSLQQFETKTNNLVGDVLLAAAFLSYAGPFDTAFRKELKEIWMRIAKDKKLPLSEDFSFSDFLEQPQDVRRWIDNKLPNDNFSIENASIVTRSAERWPLLIDPQHQATQWMKNFFGKVENDIQKIVITSFKKNKRRWMEELRISVENGSKILFEDCGEEFDQVIEPLLSRAFKGNKKYKTINIGDRDIEYNESFRMYFTTKMANPHYSPDVSTKTNVVNFSVTMEALEDQLLGIVVSKERATLEEQKIELTNRITEGQNRMEELENKILELLSTKKDNLLDDESVVTTLKDSKQTSEDTKRSLASAAETKKKIDAVRNQYLSAARRASVLYFVLCDLSKIEPMYQFSLESYINMFLQSIEEISGQEGRKEKQIVHRVERLNRVHTGDVYRKVCPGLFEKDKLLFAFQMCIKILKSEGKLNEQEYDFFLKGSQVASTSSGSGAGGQSSDDVKIPNPLEWLPDEYWENLLHLSELPNFHGIATSFEENPEEWEEWYKKPNPEETQNLPAEWSSRSDDWTKMMITRCVRPDRVLLILKNFINKEMGPQFTGIREQYGSGDSDDAPVVDIRQLYTFSDCYTPIMMILSPGADPLEQLESLAQSKGQQLKSLSLGREQEKMAVIYINEAKRHGNWVYLANCHLMIDWMVELEKIVQSFKQSSYEQYENFGEAGSERISKNFRLFLSSAPHPSFPISLLQNSLKLVMEPPHGLKNNLWRVFNNNFNAEEYDVLPPAYKKVLFALAFFHSILLDRSKFGYLGWNVVYDFNDSDFNISKDIVKNYVNKFYETLQINLPANQQALLNQANAQMTNGAQNVQNSQQNLNVANLQILNLQQLQNNPKVNVTLPWEDLKYLVAEVAYGGRVTDEMDRRILNVYINQFFNDKILQTSYDEDNNSKPFLLSEHSNGLYYIPKPAGFDLLNRYINALPDEDDPIAFGQHPNADISSQIIKTNDLLGRLQILMPIMQTSISTQSASNQSASGSGSGSGSSSGSKRTFRNEDIVEQIATEWIEKLPEQIDTSVAEQQEPTALNTVLLQELARYNNLLKLMRDSLVNLVSSIRGEAVMSQQSEDMFSALMYGKVPTIFLDCLPSTKTLAGWKAEFERRIKFFSSWASGITPSVFWLGAFSFPSGFLTALKQSFAREQSIPVDEIVFDFVIMNNLSNNSNNPMSNAQVSASGGASQGNGILPSNGSSSSSQNQASGNAVSGIQAPQEGAYIDGLFLEGGGWDFENHCLCDPKPMVLKEKLPIIHFKPTHFKTSKKKKDGVYSCPVYTYEVRDSLVTKVINIDLKVNTTPAFFVKRSTSIVLS